MKPSTRETEARRLGRAARAAFGELGRAGVEKGVATARGHRSFDQKSLFSAWQSPRGPTLRSVQVDPPLASPQEFGLDHPRRVDPLEGLERHQIGEYRDRRIDRELDGARQQAH